MQVQPRRLATLLMPLLFAGLSGCAAIMPKSVTNMAADKPVAPPPLSLNAGQDDIALQTQPQTAILDFQALDRDDPLPDVKVPAVTVTGVGYIEALRLLLDGTGFSLAVAGDVRTFEGASTGSLRIPGGTLAQVAEQLAKQGGFFLTVRGQHVTASATKRFALELPSVMSEKAGAALMNSLKRLGARDAYLDTIGNTMTFEASRNGWAAIDGFLAHMRRSKPMIVYEMEVYQLELRDGDTTSLGFKSLAKNLAQDPKDWSISSSTIGEASFALIGKNVTMSAVVNLLQTQGTVSSLSRPRVALLSGSKAHFFVGDSIKYVAKISQQTNQASANSTTTSSAELEELNTGFDLTMTGVFQEGTIATDLDLKISSLVKFDITQTFGTTLKAPWTTKKQMETVVKSRPGDLILLGGMGNVKQNDERSGGATGVSKTSEAVRSEIVLAMRPRLVRFVSAAEAQQ